MRRIVLRGSIVQRSCVNTNSMDVPFDIEKCVKTVTESMIMKAMDSLYPLASLR